MINTITGTEDSTQRSKRHNDELKHAAVNVLLLLGSVTGPECTAGLVALAPLAPWWIIGRWGAVNR